MKKNKILKILAIIIILIFIMGIILLVQFNKRANAEKMKSTSSQEGVDTIIEQKNEDTKYQMTKLRDATKFFSVEKYIQEDTTLGFEAKEMYIAEEENMTIYVVCGNKAENIEEISQAYYVLRIDTKNSAYILTEIEEQEYERMKEGSFKTNVYKIKQNEENKFAYIEPVTARELCDIYLNKFTKLELTDTKKAYELLEEDCKKEKFPDYQTFKKYVAELEKNMKEVKLKEYEVKESKDYTEYTIKDSLDNLYIVKAKGVMDYTVKID